MAITWNDIVELVNDGESQSVEFEKSITGPDDITRELVAFANSDGGKLIFGIDDKNAHFLGVDWNNELNDWILDVGKTRCNPPIVPDIDVVLKGEKSVLVLTIPEGDEKPYKTDEICYIRDGGHSRPAREEEEEEIRSPWHGHGLNKRQKRAMAFVKEHTQISNRDYRTLFGVSHKTAHLELTMLADKDLLDTQGSGRSTCYVFPAKREKPVVLEKR